MRRRELKNMEWGLLIVAIILSIIGIIALFSATQETEYDEFKKQIIWQIPIKLNFFKLNFSLFNPFFTIFLNIKLNLIIVVCDS